MEDIDRGRTRIGMDIRRLGPGDEDVLAAIAREADDFDLAGASQPESPLASPEAAAYLADRAVLHWVAEEDGLIVGELLCHVLRLPSGSGRELLLYSIGVRAAHRRRGIGAALVREMLGWARSEGIEVVWVVADNPGAEDFYAACGFARGADGEMAAYMERRVGDGKETPPLP
jgi:GNAT superfamily N-acetyltransferase